MRVFINQIRVFSISLFTWLLPSCIYAAEEVPAPIVALLEATNVPHENTWDSVVDATQQAWLRPNGLERWQCDDRYASRKAEFWPLLEEAGLTDEVAPSRSCYKYAIILGSNCYTVLARLKYFMELVQNGLAFEKILLLGSGRLLERYEQEFLADLSCENCQNEMDMMEAVWTQKAAALQIPIMAVSTPLKEVEGKLVRPTTMDTIFTLHRQYPQEQSLLFISSQPYIGYQRAVAAKVLQAPAEACGPKIPYQNYIEGRPKVSVCLDSLARQIYVEHR